ncbi:MAG: O-methyltransferase [Nitrososphaerales archaeon]
MDQHLTAFLAELEQFGVDNDEMAASRAERLLNITQDTGVFLHLLVQAVRARRILEIGASDGYSTLWLADAARATGGRVSTVECRPERAQMAAANFRRSGLASLIDLHVGEAGPHLAGQPAGSVEFLFLDAERHEYPGFWPELQRVLAPNSLLVVDNAVSHQAELAPFVALVNETEGYLTSLAPVGKGELLILKVGDVGAR